MPEGEGAVPDRFQTAYATLRQLVICTFAIQEEDDREPATEMGEMGLSGLLMALWLLIAVGNLLSLWQARRRQGSTSLILFIGGVAGFIGMTLCPIPIANVRAPAVALHLLSARSPTRSCNRQSGVSS